MLRGPALHPTATDRFLREHAGVRSPRTAEKFSWVLRALQRRYPQKRVNEFVERDLVDFLTFAEDGEPRIEGSAPATIIGYRTALISFFGWAAYAELVERNPAQHLKRIVNPRVEAVRSKHWLSEPEVEDLLLTGPEDDPRARRDRVLLATGLFSGLRVHELCGLRWGAVNLRQRSIDVLGKGGKRANQQIPGNLVEELFSWRGVYAQHLGAPPQADHFVIVNMQCRFQWVDGSPRPVLGPAWGLGIGPQAAVRLVKHHGRRVGVPDLRPHDLRRSFAGLLDNRGVELRVIQQLLRHSDAGTTERYLQDNPGRVVDSLGAALGGLRIGQQVDPYPISAMEVE